jgi:biotin transporter BioY
MGADKPEFAGFRERQFRFNPTFLAGPLAAMPIVACLAGAVYDALTNRHDSFGQFALHNLRVLPMLYLIAVLAMGAFWLANRLNPIQIGPEGIETGNLLGFTVRAKWDDVIRTVKVPIFPGVAFKMLRHGKSFLFAGYVPEFLEEPDAFAQAVAEYAGQDHPLAECGVKAGP